MPKLIWDAVGERRYETGTKQGVLYVQSAGGTYPEGVAWNGLTGFTASPEGGDANDIYADDIKYLTLRGTENFKATITAYTYPDEWMQCDGSAEPTSGVYIGQQPRKTFGFACVTTLGNDVDLDNHGYKIHLVYGASASPSERSYQTINDSPEAIEFSWEISTIPVPITGFKPTAHMEIDSTKLTSAQLKAIEDILFGRDANVSAGIESITPHLPMPDEILSIIAGESTMYTFTMVSNPSGNPSALDYYVRSGNDYIKSTDTSVVDGTVYYERTVVV